jgi:hypothetical protein
MIKRWLGIDGVDFIIQAFVTVFLAVIVSGVGPGQDVRIAGVFATSFIVLGIRRHLALKRGDPGQTSASADYVHELEHRVADLEAAQQRMYELEERVDFAERLLSQQAQRAPERIPEAR